MAMLSNENLQLSLPELAQCYMYNVENDSNNVYEEAMDGMLLSPRAMYIKSNGGQSRSNFGFSCCTNCKSSLRKKCMPRYAIANSYFVGSPPQCLLDLSEIELALLTPVKTYGYCFSYTGGAQKQLKGSLCYYKVEMESVVRSVLHFDVLGLTNNVVVLLYGQMTVDQNKKAREKSRIRTAYVLRALKWLTINNVEWKSRNISLAEVRQKLVNPVMLDNSVQVEGSVMDNNIETTESFRVFFPDGTMSSLTGGQ
jgi:hypothetical protein